MMVHRVTFLLSLFVLAACQVPEPSLQSAPATNASAPETASAPRGRAPATAVETSCYNVVNSQTAGEVTVLSNETTETGRVVMLAVADREAPWRCLVDNDGTISEVGFGAEK